MVMVYHNPEFQHECKNYKYPIYQIRPFDKDKFCIIKLNNYKDYAIYVLNLDVNQFYDKLEAKVAILDIIDTQEFMNNPDNFEFYPPIEIKGL